MQDQILIFTDFVVGISLVAIAITILKLSRNRSDVYSPKSSVVFGVTLLIGCAVMVGVALAPAEWRNFKELSPSIIFALAAGLGFFWLKTFLARVSRLPTDKELVNEEGSRRTLEAIIDAAPVAIIRADMDGIVTLWNKQAEYMFGWSAEEAVGSFMPILPPEDLVGFRQRLKDQLKGVRQKELEKMRVCKDGRLIPTSLWTAPVYDETESSVGVIGCLIDISDRQQVEKQMREAKEFAEHANVTKSKFLAKFSHELRTPLTAILGYNELLTDKSVSVENRMKYSECIRRNGSILRDLIEDILDISSIEAEKINFKKSSFPIYALIEDLEAAFKIKASNKGLIFRTEISDSLTDQLIYTDETRLRQILMNLVGNAIKFTEVGSVVLEVKKDLERQRLVFTVRDTGKGVPEADRKVIFDPFTQVDDANRSRDLGVGLGLSLSRQIARMMGGDVELVESRLGEGSVFELNLSVGDLEMTKQQMIATPKQESPTATSLAGQKILVVEDNPDLRELIEMMLTDVGADVQTAADGVEGVEKAMSSHWDVVFMDIHMPLLDGYGAVRSLRQKGFRTPVIALTASAMSEQKDKALASGYDGYVSKPVYIDQLLASISNVKLLTQDGHRH